MASSTEPVVLITGASGFTGHHMVLQAVKAGLCVRATDVSSGHYGPLFEALGVAFMAADLTRPDGLERLLEGVDGIFHIAGIHDYSTPDALMHAVNVTAVDNLCRAAVDAGVTRLVHMSSAGVYGYRRTDRPIREDDTKLAGPPNNYNVSKWEGEQLVHRYERDEGLRATCLRPAAIYGPRAEYGLFNVFRQVRKERDSKRMLMVGRGDRREAFVHIDDVCRAFLHSFDTPSMIGEAYNVSDDSDLNTTEFFNLVSVELNGVQKPFLSVPKLLLVPVAAVSQRVSVLLGRKPLLEKATLQYLSSDRSWDSTKLKDTGFVYRYPTVQSGLSETLAWYQENGWL